MQLIDMFYEQLQSAKERNVPFIIPIGTIEYHARHLSCGTDTMVITGCLRELEKEKEIVVCPPIWYGVASHAVCEPCVGHVHVDELAWSEYLYYILKSMVEGGVRNIYCVVHHQTSKASLMPMTIACHRAAKKVTMEYMEAIRGKGWWGRNDYANFYATQGEKNDPFSYIKVIPLIGAEAQIQCGGFDHAGVWETSLMMGTWPEHVDLSQCDKNTEWFSESAKNASAQIGAHMLNCTLQWLRETIQ